MDLVMAGRLYVEACRAAQRRLKRESDTRRQLQDCKAELANALGLPPTTNVEYHNTDRQLRRKLRNLRDGAAASRQHFIQIRARLDEVKRERDAALERVALLEAQLDAAAG